MEVVRFNIEREAMKIDFSSVLQDFYAKDLKNPEDINEPLTLAMVSINALMRVDPKDDGKTKFDLYNLANRVRGGVVEIEPKEAETIKTRIGQAYGQVVVGPAWRILNG